MPIYDVVAVAEALDIPAKQLDNILSRHVLSGVERQRRGVARRIPTDAVVAVSIALQLARTARMPMAAALRLARIVQDAGGEVKLGLFATLTVNVEEVRRSMASRLDGAVELVGRRPRGRRALRRVS